MGKNITLFTTFFKIGIGTIGGGYAMLPMIEHEVVKKHAWLTQEEFLDVLGISQSAPGVFAVNMSQHIGMKVGGLVSSLWATLGVILPSFIIILMLAVFFRFAENNPVVEAMSRTIRPVVVALIASPVFTMARSAGLNRYTWWIPLLSAGLIYLLGVSPVYVLLTAMVLGYLWGYFGRS